MFDGEGVVGVVLAGGEGKRLRPLTYYFQKCMIPVGSCQKPLLEYILVHLRKHGIVDAKMLVGYKHEQIVNYFDDGSRFGVRIRYYIDEPSLRSAHDVLLHLLPNDLPRRSGIGFGAEPHTLRILLRLHDCSAIRSRPRARSSNHNGRSKIEGAGAGEGGVHEENKELHPHPHPSNCQCHTTKLGTR